MSLRLNDTKGRERLIVEVAPDGSPAIRMLGEEGDQGLSSWSGPL